MQNHIVKQLQVWNQSRDHLGACSWANSEGATWKQNKLRISWFPARFSHTVVIVVFSVLSSQSQVGGQTAERPRWYSLPVLQPARILGPGKVCFLSLPHLPVELGFGSIDMFVAALLTWQRRNVSFVVIIISSCRGFYLKFKNLHSSLGLQYYHIFFWFYNAHIWL